MKKDKLNKLENILIEIKQLIIDNEKFNYLIDEALNLFKENHICSIEGCDKEVFGRGVCTKHYRQWQRGKIEIDYDVKIKQQYDDLKEQKYDKLLVVEKYKSDDKYDNRWLCKCDCGKENVIVTDYNLKTGRVKDCGCSEDKPINLLNNKYEKLLVVEKLKGEKWKCLCDCGNERIVTTNMLINSKAKSCGKCARGESKYKGVYYHVSGKWHGIINKKGVNISLGYYNTPEEAALAYNKKSLELFGEGCYLNEIKTSSEK